MDGTAFFRPLVPDDIRQIAVMALSEVKFRDFLRHFDDILTLK